MILFRSGGVVDCFLLCYGVVDCFLLCYIAMVLKVVMRGETRRRECATEEKMKSFFIILFYFLFFPASEDACWRRGKVLSFSFFLFVILFFEMESWELVDSFPFYFFFSFPFSVWAFRERGRVGGVGPTTTENSFPPPLISFFHFLLLDPLFHFHLKDPVKHFFPC